MDNKKSKSFMGALLCLVILGIWAGSAAAVTFNMTAGPTTLTMPDAAVIDMWGFALDATDVGGVITPGDGIVKVPGDPLVVPPGETSVTINLTNNLPEPVSLSILGQILAPAGGPVWTSGLSNTVSSMGARNDLTSRVRSFAHETAPGATSSYTWNNFKAGTYLLQSGTNPAKQVQMGLYAAIKKDTAGGVAYTGVPYTKELILVYSEIDPAIHAAVSGGTYGTGGVITSSVHRDPKYYLINGKAYDPTASDGGGLNPVIFVEPYEKVLVRSLNAGYDIHVPQFLNTYLQLVAEDGYPFTYRNTTTGVSIPYRKQQYGFQLPAGKTVDAVLEPTVDGKYSIHDAMLNLTNNGAATTGGMLAYYDVACAGDLDHNGRVNLVDRVTVQRNQGLVCDPGTPCLGDINKDNRVNLVDRALLERNYGRADCPIE
ncbi:MAG: hypothetical protein C4519_09455 [Desulfobacteraceae bacterium]|nr:MAG: hypothetical protein C4519_09455 [Desulfobacteraceae bacterium]